MTDNYWWEQRLAAAEFAAKTQDDDIQAAGDEKRDRDDFADYGFPIPFPPRKEDIA